jgi:thiol-disulfide isomerase/thioredoxin
VARPTKPGTPAQTTPWFLVIVAAVVAAGVAAVAAAVAFGGGSNWDTGEYAPVTVTGDALAPIDPATGRGTSAGRPAPTITGTDFDGNPVTIGGPGDKPTLVAVMAHWCPHCQDDVAKLQPVLTDPAHAPLFEQVNLITVSTFATRARPNWPPSAWLADWPTPVLVDDRSSSAAIALGTQGTPTWVAIAADGTVIDSLSGALGVEDFLRFVEFVAGHGGGDQPGQ